MYKYVDPYDSSFQAFYDDYFSHFSINNNDLLIIDQQIPLYYDGLIYWLLGYQKIKGVTINEEIELTIINNVITIKSPHDILISENITIDTTWTIQKLRDIKWMVNSDKILLIKDFDKYIRSEYIYQCCHFGMDLIGESIFGCLNKYYQPNIANISLNVVYTRTGNMVQKYHFFCYPLSIPDKHLINIDDKDKFIQEYEQLMTTFYRQTLIFQDFIITLVKNELDPIQHYDQGLEISSNIDAMIFPTSALERTVVKVSKIYCLLSHFILYK